MKNTYFKKLLPYLVAVLIFLTVIFSYLTPLLEGKSLRQGESISTTCASKELSDFRKAYPNEVILWTNSMFGGMPAYSISMSTPSNIVVSFFDDALHLFLLPNPANIIFIYFLGFFILLLVLKVDPWVGIIGALAFGFSSYLFTIIAAGDYSKATTIGYMPPVFAGVILLMRGKFLWGGMITALFLALEFKTGHIQTIYYLTILILIYLIFDFYNKLKNKQLISFSKAFAILIFAIILALGTNITALWTNYEFSKESTREKSELSAKLNKKGINEDFNNATQLSYGIDETFTLFIPNFKGGSSISQLGESSETYAILMQNKVPNIKEITYQMPLYWGSQPFSSGPVYVGAIFIFLFVLGLFIVKTPFKWFLLMATVLSILLSWGKYFMPLTEFFFRYFPMYSKFRAVSSILIIAELCIPLLGILALNQIFNKETGKATVIKFGKISLLITGGITLFFALAGSAFFDFKSISDGQLPYPEWLMNAIVTDRRSAFTIDCWRSLLFILLASACIWAFIENKYKKEFIITAFILLVVLDMFSVNKRYFDNSNFTTKKSIQKPFPATEADILILEDKDPNYRVYNVTRNPFTDATTSYFHKSLGGYHTAKIHRYQDLIEQHIIKKNVKVFNMLNTRYFIAPDQNKQPQVQRNVAALGNAWFIDNYKIVENADSEINALSNFEPATTCIIDKRFKDYVKDFIEGKDSLSTIQVIKYLPNHLTYQTSAKKNELAVFSEIYYKNGWNAYLDGKLVPYIRVNYILRAMNIPQGNHKVEFKFEPKSYFTGEKIGFASSAVLLLLLLGITSREIVLYLRKSKI
ncbi:MAG: YfhO family protein [Bacteroidetes bacterium]|nr:YfhO family protein [Bacteroidota bacterium]